MLGGEAGIRSYHEQWCRFLGTIWRGKEGPSHVFARCLSYGVGRELDEQHNITTYYAVIKRVIKLTFTHRRSKFCQAAAALLVLEILKSLKMYSFLSHIVAISAIISIHKKTCTCMTKIQKAPSAIRNLSCIFFLHMILRNLMNVATMLTWLARRECFCMEFLFMSFGFWLSELER